MISLAPSPAHTSTPDLAALIARMAAGEQAALEQLYELTLNRVYATALRVLKRPEDAEEVVLDTYAQAWERAALYVPERGEALPWLLNLAWSRAVDRLRRERRHRAALPLHPDDSDTPYTQSEDDSSQQLFDALDARSALHAAGTALSSEQKRMIALAFFEDLSHAEIAERTGLALGTVKSHLRRGLKAIARALGLAGDTLEPRP